MRIRIGKVTICNRGRLKRKLLEAKEKGFDKIKPMTYGYVLGAYDSHWFGVCIYRGSNF